METPLSPLTPATETLLQQHGGPLSVSGQQGKYVVMTSDVYEAMLGLEADEEVATLASVLRGIEDVKAGRTHAFKSLS